MASYPRWTRVLLPYTRAEFPGWGRLLSLVGAASWHEDAGAWANAPTVTLRGKRHGLLMRLDLSNWAERRTFFIGRYYELHLQLLLSVVLARGDRVLDIGANIGMITLCASALVGKDGLVESFEPNPECVRKLTEHVALNGLRNVIVHPVGLSDEAARLSLRVQTSRHAPTLHTGTGTLAPVGESADDIIVAEHQVDVLCGDELVLRDTSLPVALIKIDVEGFELRALKGLRSTLERWQPIVVTEYMEEHLVRAGASRGELREWMHAQGYVALAVYTRRAGLRHVLVAEPLKDAERLGRPINDVMWLSPTASRHKEIAGALDVSLCLQR